MLIIQFIKNTGQFLYIDPLKQGLKRSIDTLSSLSGLVFIHRSIKTRIETADGIAYFYRFCRVFIHRSIKTRIETEGLEYQELSPIEFLYIDPLKQGLKQEEAEMRRQ